MIIIETGSSCEFGFQTSVRSQTGAILDSAQYASEDLDPCSDVILIRLQTVKS